MYVRKYKVVELNLKLSQAIQMLEKDVDREQVIELLEEVKDFFN